MSNTELNTKRVQAALKVLSQSNDCGQGPAATFMLNIGKSPDDGIPNPLRNSPIFDPFINSSIPNLALCKHVEGKMLTPDYLPDGISYDALSGVDGGAGLVQYITDILSGAAIDRKVISDLKEVVDKVSDWGSLEELKTGLPVIRKAANIAQRPRDKIRSVWTIAQAEIILDVLLELAEAISLDKANEDPLTLLLTLIHN